MEPQSDPEKPFDERAALAELERVREQIQAYRAQRRDIQDEFGRFTRAFKNEVAAAPATAAPEVVAPPVRALPPPTPPAPPPQPAPPLQVEVRSELPVSDSPADASHPAAPAVEPFLPAEPTHEMLATPVPVDDPTAPRRAGSRAPAVAAVVLAVALLALLAAWMFGGSADQPASSTTSPPPAAAAVAPAPAPTPSPVAAAPAARGSELTTIRLVWMRVLVDGERVVEREVPANTKIPLAAKESIVIRAGDGGAVKLTLAGVDQGFLGPEGQPVTRTFTVPPSGAPR